MNRIRPLILALVFLSLLSSCRSRDVRVKTYRIAKKVYLWNNKLPPVSVFKPESYANPDSVMLAVRRYSPVDSTGQHADHFSYGMSKNDYRTMHKGNQTDFGCSFRFLRVTPKDSSEDLRIGSVYKNSSAGQQGVHRGWRICAINGLIPNTRPDRLDSLTQILHGKSIDVEFLTPQGERKQITLDGKVYRLNTVHKTEVIERAGHRIGYIAFASFREKLRRELDSAITLLQSQNITDLVVDLRGNLGGSMITSRHFANLLAPESARGQLMIKSEHNRRLGWLIDRKWNFRNHQKGRLVGIKRIAFITNNTSASASEMLISALKPYCKSNMALVGGKSLGKNLGFFPVTAHPNKPDAYTTWFVSLRVSNAEGPNDHFDGFDPDVSALDDLTHDFGDQEEASFNAALDWIVND